MKIYKIFAINLGSTSTKVAYYENDSCVLKDNIQHSQNDIDSCKSIFDQYGFRKRDIDNFMSENNINIKELDAIVSRGGPTEPIEGGTYLIEENILNQIKSGKYGIHPCSLGCQIAYDIAKDYEMLPLTVDLPGTCEFNPLAYYTGLPEIKRFPSFQALNNRAMARQYAINIGKEYEDLNLVVCMLGGGITVTAHERGRMVDAQDGITGDGAFSNNRCNGLPTGQLIDMCYSGKYSYEEMIKKVNGDAGLKGYLGTIDVKEIVKEAEQGNQKYAEVLAAMCYQTSKDIGAFATVLNGQVDAILLIGGMANSKYITNLIKQRVSYIAPIVVMPGELEMESLCMNSYWALTGKIKIKHFKGVDSNV